jgi:hypothetical protein
MTYIRIKVKHLIIVVAAVMAVFAMVFYLQGGILYAMGKISELSGSTERASAYYDRVVKEYPSSNSAIIAAQRKLELLFDKKDFGYLRKLKLTGGTTVLGGAYISADSADRVNLQYESIAEYAARNDTFAEYSVYVAMVNYFAGYGDRAVKILEGLDYVKNAELKKVGELNLAAMQMGLGNMEEGFGLLKKDIDTKDKYSLIRRKLYSYYLFMKGDFEGLKGLDPDAVYRDQAAKPGDNLILKPLLQIDDTLSNYKDIIENTEDLKQSGNVLSGKASIDGKPAAYVMIFLKDTNFRNVMDSSSMGKYEGIRCAAVTGGDGSFKIENVPDGIYGIGVSIGWQRVQGKALQMDKSFNLKFAGSTTMEKDISFFDTNSMVKAEDIGDGKFRFEVNLPVEAKYYTINMGELSEPEEIQIIANDRFYSDRINTSEYILDTAEERTKGMNTGASFGSDGIDPRYLMEPFYHTGDYAYDVTFYDKNGNILFDSNGIYPSSQKGVVHIAGSQWSEADKLVLDKKYDEAIKLYEAQLNDRQQGLHALKVLTKLYYNGWEYDKATSALKYKDTKKAAAYFEKLAGLIRDNEQINSSLARIYTDEGRYQEGLELLQRNTSPYGIREIGQVYGYMGKFIKETECYKSFNSQTGLGADSLLMLYILQDKKELLPETAASYKDNGSFYADYEKPIQDYLKMDTTAYKKFFSLIGEDRPDAAAELIECRKDDLALLYKGLLLLQKRIPDYKEREKQYKSFYDGVNNDSIRQLLGNFGKEYIQSGFGDEQNSLVQ